MLQKLLFLTLVCGTFHRIQSVDRHHAVVDIEQDGPHFRGKIHVNGNSHNLNLQSPENSVFAPNFRLTESVMSPEGELILRDISTHQHPSELEEHIYVDEDANAAFRVENIDGEIRMHGMMGDIHISHDGQNHFAIVHEAPAPSDNYTMDYRETDLEFKFTPDESLDNRQIVAAEPELYMVMDKKLYETLSTTRFGASDGTLRYYLSVLVRGVNNRYKTVSNPSIKFKVIGANILKTPDVQPFIEDSREGASVSISKVLDNFAVYMRKNAGSFPKHDLAPLVSAEEFGNTVGLAWVNGACRDGNVDKSLRTSVNNDKEGTWTGIHTLAHELAHNMGSPHDGDTTRLCSAKDCPWTAGYIMTYSFDPVKSLTFSECSKNCMSTYIKTKDAACVRETSASPWVEAANEPGAFLSYDQQCQKRTGKSDAKVLRNKKGNEICGQIMCEYPTSNGGYMIYQYGEHPLDGTPCGDNGTITGKCTEGKCI